MARIFSQREKPNARHVSGSHGQTGRRVTRSNERNSQSGPHSLVASFVRSAQNRNSGFRVAWNDSWSIYRGDERVAILSGSNKQALQVGNYVVKPTFNSAFAPFKVRLTSDSTTTIKFGGVLRFNWPGNDSWTIYRGDELVATHSGSDSQALEAGTYVIKPTFNQAFAPFTVNIVDGATVKVP
jgi:hypothetical protein